MRKKAIKNLLTLVLTFSALLPLLPSPGSSPCPLCTAALSDQDWYLFDRFSGALLPLYLLLGQPGTGWFDQTNHLMQERLENGTALARFPAGAVPPAYCDRHRPGPGKPPGRSDLVSAHPPGVGGAEADADPVLCPRAPPLLYGGACARLTSPGHSSGFPVH